ncbi:MAG: phytanoyl-CoA dioxygenase [Betaproteobacteria bacterium]|nr:MAG: phytanoyl-CoA dioxygenase [Betaproteobacteria bacterium]
MPKLLTQAQVDQYRRDGYVYPLRAFSAERALELRRRLESCEARFGPLKIGGYGSRPHLLFTWADEIVHDSGVLDAVEDLVGADIRVYTVTLWMKNANDGAIVDWHQDASYFGLEPAEQVTAWVALTESAEQSGCLKVLPGSNERGLLHHSVKESAARTLLPRGQSITRTIDTSSAVSMPLKPGEFSLHHTLIVHGSEANHSNDRRIGLGVSYIPTRVRFTGSTRLSAMLVRGTDRYGHFDDEPRPAADCDEAARAAHERITKTYFGSKQELAKRYENMPVEG